MSVIKEFKEFISRGNAFDLAVGVIVGGAFGPIVKSMVDDVIMPFVSLGIGKVDFSNLYVPLSLNGVETVKNAVASGGKLPTLAEAKADGAVIAYGNLLNTFVTFFFLMLGVFILVKIVNTLRKKKEEAPAEPTKTEALLGEIRDLLKKP
ncbi:MAG TPA: large conductance mechanosensitive channel protein MscL [Chthoniobacterales bacterium]